MDHSLVVSTPRMPADKMPRPKKRRVMPSEGLALAEVSEEDTVTSPSRAALAALWRANEDEPTPTVSTWLTPFFAPT